MTLVEANHFIYGGTVVKWIPPQSVDEKANFRQATLQADNIQSKLT